MRFNKPTPTIICLLPFLAFIPIVKDISAGVHSGGVNILVNFLASAIHPSLERSVLESSLQGLKVTVSIALFGWLLSFLFGTFLGIISSDIFWVNLMGKKWIGIFIRRFLAIPRAIHEVVWGLFLLQVFGLNPWVAILAITIPYSSLMARVISNQLDSLKSQSLIAIKQTGAEPIASLITSLFPPMRPIIATYGGYQIECSLRGATLLGIFGLGGIGTELQLTLQSLEFREMWTSLWILGILMVALEKFLSWLRGFRFSLKPNKNLFMCLVIIILFFIAIGSQWLNLLGVDVLHGIKFYPINLPGPLEIKDAIKELPLIRLTLSTIVLTLLSAGIAIGTPPICLMLFPKN